MLEMFYIFVQNGSNQPLMATEHWLELHMKIGGTKAQEDYLVVQYPRARIATI